MPLVLGARRQAVVVGYGAPITSTTPIQGDPNMSDFSRRTVVRGAAWTVPVVAVATQAPAFAVSPPPPPPPPVIRFNDACGNTGSTGKGCGGKFTLQVPLTLTNPTDTDVVFQLLTMYTSNVGPAPTGPGAGVYSGVTGIYATPDHQEVNEDNCNLVTNTTCVGGIASVLVPAGTTVPQTYWIESNQTGSADDFASSVTWQVVSATGCTVLSSGGDKTVGAISPGNCNGDSRP
jgi:hypothetical protein